MRNNSHKIWLRGCKPKTFKKYNNRVWIDGIGYNVKNYTNLIKKHKKVCIGDYIFNPYRSIWEPVRTIRTTWTPITDKKAHNNIKYLEIVFITETNFVVYDLNEYSYYFLVSSSVETPPVHLGTCHF